MVGSGGYIRKFSLVSGTWVANGNIGVTNQGTRGLVGKVEAGVVTLYVTETEPLSVAAGGNAIRKLVDVTGHNASIAGASLSLLVSGVNNTAYRGIAFVPQPAIVPNPVIDAGGGANNIVVSKSGANLVVTVNGTQVFAQSLASTLSLTLNGEGGADTLKIDYSAGGFFNLPISFDGGSPTMSPGDKLEIKGGSFTTVETTYTGPSSGDVNLDGTVISFTGIEPLLVDSDATANYEFNLRLQPMWSNSKTPAART